jgi:hypothetical protein
LKFESKRGASKETEKRQWAEISAAFEKQTFGWSCHRSHQLNLEATFDWRLILTALRQNQKWHDGKTDFRELWISPEPILRKKVFEFREYSKCRREDQNGGKKD